MKVIFVKHILVKTFQYYLKILLNIFQQDYRKNYNNGMLLNMNLVPVYEELKCTGKGIRVAIIDDGIEYTHDDLKDNYVSICLILLYFINIKYYLVTINRFYLFSNCTNDRLFLYKIFERLQINIKLLQKYL